MRVRRIHTGAETERYHLYAVCTDRGTAELEGFLEEYADHAVAVMRCMSDAAERGPHFLPKNRVHLIDKNEKLYEFIGGRLRVVFFTDDAHIVICSHGFLKSTQTTPQQHKKKAARARSAYQKAKKSNNLIFEEEN